MLLHTDLQLWISRDTNDSFFDSRQNLSRGEETTNIDKTHCRCESTSPRVKALNANSMPEKLFSTKQSDTSGSILPSVPQHCLHHRSIAEAEQAFIHFFVCFLEMFYSNQTWQFLYVCCKTHKVHIHSYLSGSLNLINYHIYCNASSHLLLCLCFTTNLGMHMKNIHLIAAVIKLKTEKY